MVLEHFCFSVISLTVDEGISAREEIQQVDLSQK